MQQYNAIKAQLPAGTILLLRLGDFYEVFGPDAATVAKVLEITLTNRRGIPMAGIPFHCIDTWAHKLTETGLKVSAAEYSPEFKP